MDQQQVREYLLNKPFSVETFPFGEDVAVFKVKHKMFATLSRGKLGKDENESENIYWLNLKSDPQEAIMLRDIFPSVVPGYHMSKVHWNTVKLDGTVPKGEIQRMIDNSFDLVVANMVKKDQQSILLHR
ncbi:MmcQ/YjbR family DNA-binding protein [uncultured Paraglaciecola sp.]|uniref:MmcQ/YjbR family DNA-binding protein n=1 Tax=uncultured Paraglaciecola sp. TaxID=1765024 RepID=UPI0030DC30E5|tara:strand:- start:11073 stop:11459 length:387 start_codon:yes stop_codon:yes gene_type:complete